MSTQGNSNNKFPYKCKIASMDLLSIFLKYKGKKGVLAELLTEIKKRFGAITEEDLVCITEYLNISEKEIKETLKLHKEFKILPVKQHVFRVCSGLVCQICGSDKILETASNKLKLLPGEATKDSKFKLEIVECTGLCEIAPVMAIDNTFYGKIDETDTATLIAHEKRKITLSKFNQNPE